MKVHYEWEDQNVGEEVYFRAIGLGIVFLDRLGGRIHAHCKTGEHHARDMITGEIEIHYKLERVYKLVPPVPWPTHPDGWKLGLP